MWNKSSGYRRPGPAIGWQEPAGALGWQNIPLWGSGNRGTPVQGWHSLKGRKPEARVGQVCILPEGRTGATSEIGPAGEMGHGRGSPPLPKGQCSGTREGSCLGLWTPLCPLLQPLP